MISGVSSKIECFFKRASFVVVFVLNMYLLLLVHCTDGRAKDEHQNLMNK